MLLIAPALVALVALQAEPTAPIPTAPPDAPIDAPAAAPLPAADRYTITLGPDAAKELAEGEAGPGRLLLFFIREGTHAGRRMLNANPMDAPFYANPQPLASVEVTSLKEGATIVVDGAALAWPTSVDQLEGQFRVQAVYRRNRDARGHQAEGNLFTAEKTITLDHSADNVALLLDQVMKAEPLPTMPGLKWIELKSRC